MWKLERFCFNDLKVEKKKKLERKEGRVTDQSMILIHKESQ